MTNTLVYSVVHLSYIYHTTYDTQCIVLTIRRMLYDMTYITYDMRHTTSNALLSTHYIHRIHRYTAWCDYHTTHVVRHTIFSIPRILYNTRHAACNIRHTTYDTLRRTYIKIDREALLTRPWSVYCYFIVYQQMFPVRLDSGEIYQRRRVHEMERGRERCGDWDIERDVGYTTRVIGRVEMCRGCGTGREG